MRSLWMWSLAGIAALAAVGQSARATVNADLYRYEALLDTDSNSTTGCDVMVREQGFDGMVSGVEFVVTAIVERFPSKADVDEVFVRQCLSGTTFSPLQVVNNGDWPVGLDDGVNGADVVEFYVRRDAIGDPSTVRLAFHASRSIFNDVLLTTNGQTAGGPIIFELPARQAAPALSAFALAVAAALLTGFACWRLRRRGTVPAIGFVLALLTTLVMTAWAVTIALDGNVGDWAGVPPAAVDALNDSSVGDPAEDIVEAFVTADSQNLYFRMDQVNLAPVVCGNGIIESGETCESNSDCTPASLVTGQGGAAEVTCACVNCQCVGTCN